MACAWPTYLPPLAYFDYSGKAKDSILAPSIRSSAVIQSLHSFREVSMPENQEVLRQALLTDLVALRENLDKTWTIVLTLPIGTSRTNLELIHQSSSQLVLNMKKTLMEMV
jgi:hypothetical protein